MGSQLLIVYKLTVADTSVKLRIFGSIFQFLLNLRINGALITAFNQYLKIGLSD